MQRQHQDSNGNLYNGMTSVCWKLLIKTEVASTYGRVCVWERKSPYTTAYKKWKNWGGGEQYVCYLHSMEQTRVCDAFPTNHWDCWNVLHIHIVATNREDQQRLSVTIRTFPKHINTTCCHYQYLTTDYCSCCFWAFALECILFSTLSCICSFSTFCFGRSANFHNWTWKIKQRIWVVLRLAFIHNALFYFSCFFSFFFRFN